MSIKDLRSNYNKSSINFQKLVDNPIVFFMQWFNEALEENKYEANSCVLSTVNSQNKPSSRVVLLKGVKETGFVFFTNYTSRKANNISDNPNVALNFFWPYHERQVRIQGIANKLSNKDSEDYFSIRPRDSQIGAWVSKQSEAISMDHDFSDEIKKVEKMFSNKKINKPKQWGGYCIDPIHIEFWQGRPSRLHDRLLYTKVDDIWIADRLSP
tara:strand:- start:535 stop:1170 length:636 start_codon:yes stop_codon:yes gene_type:complete